MQQNGSSHAKTIVISGASGLIGSELSRYFEARGYLVKRLIRHKPKPYSSREVYWNPDSGHIEIHALEGADAIVHLAGRNLGSARWTKKEMLRIRDSRMKGTELLSRALLKLYRKPQVLVCASGIGYYGDTGDERVTEETPGGSGFLAELCKDWEQAASNAQKAGVRVVNLRTATVLSEKGGYLKRMLPLFRFWFGGPLGNPKDYFSWIALDDVIAAIHFAIGMPEIEGPINLCSPNPVTNQEFAHILGEVMHKPSSFHMPSSLMRLVLGKMVDEVILKGCKAYPQKLLAHHFEFRHEDLKTTLTNLLKKSR